MHSLSSEDFYERARLFHGCASPGLMLGASMVDLALHSLGRTQQYDALCETSRCLPDAVQLLTPCTAGNGRLHIVELGRFALCLYHQVSGKGVRVYLDHAKTTGWPNLNRWARGVWTGSEKDIVRLEREIRHAGISVLSARSILIQDTFLHRQKQEPGVACISCGELHPASMGPQCRACQGRSPYIPRLPAEISSFFR